MRHLARDEGIIQYIESIISSRHLLQTKLLIGRQPANEIDRYKDMFGVYTYRQVAGAVIWW